MITELVVLIFFLAIALLLAPIMTNVFFLERARTYSDAHKTSLILMSIGLLSGCHELFYVWPLFCLFGFALFLRREYRNVFTFTNLAICSSFLFSLISAVWFVAGSNNLRLLGYDRIWSFYAALHGAFLGWLILGSFAFLANRQKFHKIYLGGCFLGLVCFLLIAFGIDGIPFVKAIGVLGLFLTVPSLVGFYAWSVRYQNRKAYNLSLISFLAVTTSLCLALVNEFLGALPKSSLGLNIPVMVLAHGLINAAIAAPCFFFAIKSELDEPKYLTLPKPGVVFFDGYCVLCNSTVSRLIAVDKYRRLRYSSLQGEYALETLEPQQVQSIGSVVFLYKGITYEKSEAVLQILSHLGGIYKVTALFLNLLPYILLDKAYEFVARNRYKIFGKTQVCRIPSPEEKSLFIS